MHRRFIPIGVASFAVLLAAAMPSRGDDPKFNKIDLSDGPVLYFVHPEANKDDDREEVVYLFDPAKHESPRELWRGPNPPPRPIMLSYDQPSAGRPAPHLMILERRSRGMIVDLRRGAAEALDEKHPTKVLSVEEKQVFFLQQSAPQGLMGYKLARDENGVIITESYARQRDYLCMHVIGEGASKRLCDTVIERVLFTDTDGFWVITAGKDRKIARISRKGELVELAAFDDHWVAPMTRYALSPKWKFLALSTLHDRHDFHKQRELMVVDVEQKKTILTLEKVKVYQHPFSSTSASLWVDWLGDSRLSIGSDPQRVIDLPDGAELDRKALDRLLDEFEDQPEEPRRKTIGHFDHEWGLLYFKGEAKPVASVLDESGSMVRDMEIDPQGRWASYVGDDAVWFVDGKTRLKSQLVKGWAYDLHWMPSNAK